MLSFRSCVVGLWLAVLFGCAATRSRPMSVVPLRHLSAGARHACYLRGDTAYCWGEIFGPAVAPVETPLALVLDAGAASIRCGSAGISCVLDGGRGFICWRRDLRREGLGRPPVLAIRRMPWEGIREFDL